MKKHIQFFLLLTFIIVGLNESVIGMEAKAPEASKVDVSKSKPQEVDVVAKQKAQVEQLRQSESEEMKDQPKIIITTTPEGRIYTGTYYNDGTFKMDTESDNALVARTTGSNDGGIEIVKANEQGGDLVITVDPDGKQLVTSTVYNGWQGLFDGRTKTVTVTDSEGNIVDDKNNKKIGTKKTEADYQSKSLGIVYDPKAFDLFDLNSDSASGLKDITAKDSTDVKTDSISDLKDIVVKDTTADKQENQILTPEAKNAILDCIHQFLEALREMFGFKTDVDLASDQAAVDLQDKINGLTQTVDQINETIASAKIELARLKDEQSLTKQLKSLFVDTKSSTAIAEQEGIISRSESNLSSVKAELESLQQQTKPLSRDQVLLQIKENLGKFLTIHAKLLSLDAANLTGNSDIAALVSKYKNKIQDGNSMDVKDPKKFLDECERLANLLKDFDCAGPQCNANEALISVIQRLQEVVKRYDLVNLSIAFHGDTLGQAAVMAGRLEFDSAFNSGVFDSAQQLNNSPIKDAAINTGLQVASAVGTAASAVGSVFNIVDPNVVRDGLAIRQIVSS